LNTDEVRMGETTLHGSCLCGAVTYMAKGTEKRAYHCHCRRCRKATGTGHASNLFLQPGTLQFLSGESLVRSYKVPEAARFTNVFCSECGSRVARQTPGSDTVLLPLGSLDDEPALKPQAHIFTDSRAGWSCSGDDLPTFPEMPPT